MSFVIAASSMFLLFAWLCATEGSFLGNRLTVCLYNGFAWCYERKWRAAAYRTQETQQRLFEQPLRVALGTDCGAQFVDLACGTGRMSRLLLDSHWFRGTIVAVDASRAMLRRFKKGIEVPDSHQSERCELVCQNIFDWQSPEPGQFHAVALMEVTEFLPSLEPVLREAYRALKPGGLLMLTKVPDHMSWLFPGRRQSSKQLRSCLNAAGFDNIRITPWQWRYEVVYATKPRLSEIPAEAMSDHRQPAIAAAG